MRIAEHKQTGTRTEEKTIIIPAEYDENGNILTEEHEETVSVEVPVYGMVYRTLTPEEEQALKSEEPEEPPVPTIEERVDSLETAVDILLNGVVE